MKHKLYYYSVLGQKWCARRYQNQDGSLIAKRNGQQCKEVSKWMNH